MFVDLEAKKEGEINLGRGTVPVLSVVRMCNWSNKLARIDSRLKKIEDIATMREIVKRNSFMSEEYHESLI
jgi:hypothetical protein